MKAKSKGVSQTIIVVSILSLVAVNILSMAKIRYLEKELNLSSIGIGVVSRSEVTSSIDKKITPLWEIVSAHQKWLELNGNNLKEISDLMNKNFEEIFTIIEKQRNALSGS